MTAITTDQSENLSGRCRGCTHKCYDGNISTICLACKRYNIMVEKDTGTDDRNDCPDAFDKRDPDGDFDTYCASSGHCQYQHNVRDCDGDIVSLCRK